ncbi:MFS transporter [Corynebacterium poyangense]|uniref:MFS transporter n=1 Tax=Corynebacterium poyangense TaxID=2684405 RepID=A0A7H0SR29_9CORY|nr:MFS transporter [Corynebacterium poyangense]MBZ8176427.1 MFS transporter [Corynebacterium poyangense]QNQ91004.1 MFS transporter [Corynebacterium poyangense]
MTTQNTQTERSQSTLKTLAGTGVGNALEWFDWNIYATFAVFFSSQLFNSEDGKSAFLKTMAVFAVGFIARPFGGFFFGWLADRIGRKESLAVAVLCASAGSILIAITPTYHQVGWVASAILLLARLIQGLAHGGELPSAQTYLAEHAPRDKRGLWASSIYVTGTFGILLGMIFGLILESLLSEQQLMAWGWRIPFAVGAVLGISALWMRLHMDESEVFEAEKERKAEAPQAQRNVFVQVAKNWPTALKVVGMTAGLTVSYYVWSVTMPALAQKSFGFSASDAFTASIIGNAVFIISLICWGWASDRIGRKPTMLIAMIGSAILYLPLVHYVVNQQSMFSLVLAISIQLFLLAAFLGHAPATYAEMFDTDQRASGFGIPYALTIAIFGGTAGMIMTWLDNNIHFAYYSIVLLVISAITILTLKETKGVDLHGHYPEEY